VFRHTTAGTAGSYVCRDANGAEEQTFMFVVTGATNSQTLTSTISSTDNTVGDVLVHTIAAIWIPE